MEAGSQLQGSWPNMYKFNIILVKNIENLSYDFSGNVAVNQDSKLWEVFLNYVFFFKDSLSCLLVD